MSSHRTDCRTWKPAGALSWVTAAGRVAYIHVSVTTSKSVRCSAMTSCSYNALWTADCTLNTPSFNVAAIGPELLSTPASSSRATNKPATERRCCRRWNREWRVTYIRHRSRHSCNDEKCVTVRLLTSTAVNRPKQSGQSYNMTAYSYRTRQHAHKINNEQER